MHAVNELRQHIGLWIRETVHKAAWQVAAASTFSIEVATVLKMVVWVVWLIGVRKDGVMLPFWGALNAKGGMAVWAVLATLIGTTMFAGIVHRKWALLKIFGMALGSVYWTYLCIITFTSIPTALLPWLALLTAIDCLWSLCHRVAVSK